MNLGISNYGINKGANLGFSIDGRFGIYNPSINRVDPNVIPLEMDAGLFDFSVNGGNPVWTFGDGSTSTELRPTRTLTEPQTVYLKLDDVSSPTLELKDNGTDSAYVGDIKILKRLSYYANFDNCTNLTGDISALSNVSYYANFYNCNNLTGDISNLSNISYLASFYNCTNLTGDISALSNVSYFANFYNCNNLTGDISNLSNISYFAGFTNCSNLTGILNPHPSLKRLYLNNTGLSINDVDQTVINLDNNTTATGTRVLSLAGLQRSSASTSAINSLITKGWSVTDATVV